MSFEGLADQAAEGVNTATSDSSQQQPTQNTPSEGNQEASQIPSKAEAIFDLSKAQKFLFEGKEMTYEDLKKSYLRQQDYTKKTQEIAAEKKFSDNLSWDLKKVKANPQLAEEFKKLYPEKYHAYLDVVLDKAANQSQSAQLPPEILEKLSKHEELLSSFQNERQEAESAKINNTLETYEQKFTKKYPNAEIGSVYHALEAHVNKMREENPQYGIKDLTEKQVEGIYKSTHEYFNKRFEDWQKSKLQTIRESNKRGGDIPPGGGIPGDAPAKTKLKDVADQILNSPDF